MGSNDHIPVPDPKPKMHKYYRGKGLKFEGRCIRFDELVECEADVPHDHEGRFCEGELEFRLEDGTQIIVYMCGVK